MTDWAGYLGAAVLVSLIPGANQLLGLGNAVRYGAARAMAGVAGRLAAFVVLIGLVVAGLGAVLIASGTALETIKWVGVVYLAWLGVSSLRSGLRPAGPGVAPADAGGAWRSIVTREFAVAISNPKALLLFAALLPQFTDTTAPGASLDLALLGAVYLLIELVVGLGYIGLGRRLGATGIPARTQRRVDLGTGVVFLGLAGFLAVDDLS
ncbi:threonine transporter RhtB [Paractinoplanes abujensis]|uniref:Threonine/homoserine/homoserine lactone efflux protein n=1 Tax=Paractinoplanes abujensis TaxID=882441 RepID=A0A7W7CRJ3_9ACTN|nr:LysE family translocator [Actinoplanes abujensis]MBB4693404.1 threonine/homoserine/homoserine lactone efflux protein [Actinoplanes abujensis]GID24608.1 threonine transporter RhtB [Actinoplanes abujensis]